MGQFSWLDCDGVNEKHRAILDDVKDNVYVLVPKEFGGGHILETEYDGYGNFGGYDIYDLVADWNKEYITSDAIKKPVREQYDDKEKEKYYQQALKTYNCEVNRLKDFKDNIDNKIMVERYGKDWKRGIGIDIACYDEDNARLKYPIKITHNADLTYEDVKDISLGDPNQGWGLRTDESHDYNYAIEKYRLIKKGVDKNGN